MFRLIKNFFMGLLTIKVNVSNRKKCVSLGHQKCMTQPTLINFFLMNFHYYWWLN